MLSTLPHAFLAMAAGILGAIWGSFAAALCSRWPRGEGVVSGRSRCDHCAKVIDARDLVPIFSFLWLRGGCRECGGRIGPLAIGTEIAGFAIGATAFLLLPPDEALQLALFGWLLLPLAILDWQHLWLPDRLLALLAFVGLLLALVTQDDSNLASRVIGGVAGVALLDIVRRGYRLLRKQEGMGAGDPKLMGAIGLWLGWQMLPYLLLAASALGLVHAMTASGKVGQGQRFPFGTYLAVAAFLVAAGAAALA